MSFHTLIGPTLAGLLAVGAHGPSTAVDDGGSPAVAALEPPGQSAPVRVVATLPIYADIAEQIGGDQVTVSAIADPREDAHFVRPRPSFALDIRRADMLITTGLDLELWLPALLDKAGNARVGDGGPGYVTAYTGIELLDVPASADRSQGDIHVYGNPHIYTDPLNVVQVARNITAGLKNVAPERAERFDRGLSDFADRVHRRLFGDRLVEMLDGPTLERLAREGKLMSFLENTPYEGRPLIAFLGGWLEAAMRFRGRQIICFHKNWAYFENRFGVRCADYVEAKPGIPPTPRHVANLIDMMRNQGIHVIFAANYFDRSKVETVARRADATAVIVPMEPGGEAGLETYFDVVDSWVARLDRAFRPAS